MGLLAQALRAGGGNGDAVVSQGGFRKSRRGRVSQVMRERYLRDDIGLGELVGRAALRDERELASVLGDEHLTEDGLQLVLVLDTNVALRQIDVLEKEACAALQNVVVCDTVLQEARKLDLSVYNRLLLLLRDDKRTFITFPNENHRETWAPQAAGESPNDYNDRLIRRAAKWYASQVEGSSVAQVLLLTNDRKCRDAACKEGLRAKSIQDFVASIADKYPGIVDLVADADERSRERGVPGDRRAALEPKFPAHLSLPEINRRLKAGTLVQGTFRANAFNRNEGSIMCYSGSEANKEGRKVVIRGFVAMNRAIDGDRVAVELVAEPDADASKKGGKRKNAAANEGDEDDDEGDGPAQDDGLLDEAAENPEDATLMGTKRPNAAAEGAAAASSGGTQYGRVAGIIQRNWRQYCGSVSEKDAARPVPSENVLVLPVDTKIPRIRIRTKQLNVIKNQRILVSIDSWDRFSSQPSGHFVKAMGPIGDRKTETAVILHEHDIPTREFSRKVMKCLPSEGADWKVTPENSVGRTDLRHLPVCSIDPPGCKDIDDALHVRRLENGNLEVGVHIADVTHFVRHDTEIDREAASRATSTYLVERRLDMLPGLLTTDICSLRGKVDRFAFSVIWEFTPPTDPAADASGKKKGKRKRGAAAADKAGEGDGTDDGRGLKQVNVRFCKSIIHSRAAMSYGEAQAWLEDPSVEGELPDAVRMLDKIAKVLRQRRVDRGALTLASQEVRFKLDNESHDPTDVEMYQQKDANMLVEEFMLLANITVAKRTCERYPSYAMLRRHPKPAREMFNELLAATEIAGVKLKVGSSKELADSLDNAVKPDRPFFNKLVRIMATRCMMQAVYFTSGEVAPAEYGHYGLASDIYTHFTSPIRRYADVVVHRLLAAAEGIDPLPVAYEKKDGMKAISDNLNRRHHMAQLAGRASIALHTTVYFRDRPTEAIAMISRVRDRGVVVVVPQYGIEGKINLSASEEEARAALTHNPEEMRLTHKASGVSLQIFQQVKVRLEVQRGAGHRESLLVSLVDPPIAAPSADSAAPGSATKKKRGSPSTSAAAAKPSKKKRKSK